MVTETKADTLIITNLHDAHGNGVADGGATADRTVTFIGRAMPNEHVEIFDASNPVGIADVDSSGKWTLTLGGLTIKTYSITAKGLYADNPVSNVWTVRVGVPEIVIAQVIGGNNNQPIPNGGTTPAQSANFSGTYLLPSADRFRELQLLDNGNIITTGLNGGPDYWYAGLLGMAFGVHRVTVKDPITGQESAAWTITRV